MMRREGYSFNKVFAVVLLTFLFASVVFRATPSATKTSAIDEKNATDKEEKGSSRSIAAMTRDDDFQLALRESLGFFDDIPAHVWQRMKAITSASQPYQKRSKGGTEEAPNYYAANWDPNFSC